MSKQARAIEYKPFKGPLLVVVDDKHGPSHYLAQTEAELHSIALEILRDRYDRGFYDTFGGPPDPLEQIDEEVLKRLPASTKAHYLIQVGAYRKAVQQWEAVSQTHTQSRLALEHQDGFAALKILMVRQQEDGEYLSFEHMTAPEVEGGSPENPLNGQVWAHPVVGYRVVFDAKGQRWVPHIYVSLEHNIAAADGTFSVPISSTKRNNPV